MTTSNTNKLYRSRENKMVFGVAGGLAEYFDVDPTIVRLAFVLFTLANGIGLIAYMVMAIIVPKAESASSSPGDVMRENIQGMPDEVAEAGRRVREVMRGASSDGEAGESPPTIETDESPVNSRPDRRRITVAMILIGAGALLLLSNFGTAFFWWLRLDALWPIALVVIGVVLLTRRAKNT